MTDTISFGGSTGEQSLKGGLGFSCVAAAGAGDEKRPERGAVVRSWPSEIR